MAIITEFYKTRADGTALYRTYSDEGRQVIREDGAVFDEAVDPLGSGHTYAEGEVELIYQTRLEELIYQTRLEGDESNMTEIE